MLPDRSPASVPAHGTSSRRSVPAWLLYLLVPAFSIAAAATAVAVVRGAPLQTFGFVLAALFAVPFLWTLTSALWPASADRRCPGCGSSTGLERLDASTTLGVRCRACGFEDEAQSSWLLAEEEGPLEDIVLGQRARRRAARRGVRPSPVDSPVDSHGPGDYVGGAQPASGSAQHE